MKIKRIAVGLGVAAVSGLVIWSLTAKTKIDASAPAQAQTDQEISQEPQRTIAAVPSVSAPAQQQPENLLPSIAQGEFPQPEVIQKFKVIQAKVFRSADDEKQWKIMISDSRHLLQLGQYLKDLKSIDSEDFKANQNAAIDLLIAALKGGDAATAEQAILEVIKDAQVEDDKLAQSSRDLLGGIKAELLYESSSIKPELAEQLEKILPGPVSQKIWKNVQQQQADNLALSEADLQERIARKSNND